MTQDTCRSCGAAIADRHPRDTCSSSCYEYIRRYPDYVYTPWPCDICGVTIPPGSHKSRKYCSDACKRDAGYRKRVEREFGTPAPGVGRTGKTLVHAIYCAHCGGPMPAKAKPNTRFCSSRCSSREAAGPGSYEARRGRLCAWCGEEVGEDKRLGARYCTDTCTVLANQQIRRARRLRRPFETFSRRAVFERDQWLCHICGDPTDREVHSRHPLSPSLDHLIPIAEDGSPGHVMVNTACAHLRCNMAKNNRATEADRALYRELLAAATVVA